MDDKLFLLFFYVVAGLLLVALSVPLLREKVRPNPLYGFRVPKTFASTEVWYAANKYAARRLMWAGSSAVVAAIGLYFLPKLSLDLYAFGCLAVFVVVLAAGLIQSFRYLRTL